MTTVPETSDFRGGLAVVTPAPSYCWRVFVQDLRGTTWAPIIAAADAVEVRTKTLAIYRGGTVLEAERMHVDAHADGGDRIDSVRYRETA